MYVNSFRIWEDGSAALVTVECLDKEIGIAFEWAYDDINQMLSIIIVCPFRELIMITLGQQG